MLYIRTVYRNGKRTHKPCVVSADVFNRILLQAITQTQMGNEYTLYKEPNEDGGADYYEIKFSDGKATYIHFYEPYVEEIGRESRFSNYETLPDGWSGVGVYKSFIESTFKYVDDADTALQRNAKTLKRFKDSGAISTKEYKELRDYNRELFSQMPL